MSDLPELFTCPRHAGGLRLTAAGCARSWTRHRADDESPCHGCPIGAGHAGAPVEVPPISPPCAWCGRSGRRMVRGHTVCISCYNRLREIAIGKDRRGKAPLKILFVFEVSDNAHRGTESAGG